MVSKRLLVLMLSSLMIASANAIGVKINTSRFPVNEYGDYAFLPATVTIEVRTKPLDRMTDRELFNAVYKICEDCWAISDKKVHRDSATSLLLYDFASDIAKGLSGDYISYPQRAVVKQIETYIYAWYILREIDL